MSERPVLLGELAEASWRVLAAGLVWAALLLLVSPARAQFFSPGELAEGHAALEGDGHCGDCHSAGSRVANDKCVACHQDVGRSVRKKTGLHGREALGQSCGSCHVDHRGREHELIRWDRERFDHARAGWALGGRHRELACAKCHTGKNERQQPTYIGLASACASCHEDKHRGRFGQACQTCHDDVSWKNLDLDPFDHSLARFPLRGAHQKVACAKCHTGEPPKYQPLAFEACGDCHQDPHRGKLGADCESCHVERSWKEIDMERAAHPGLNIQAGHARVKCQACHDRGTRVSPSKGKQCVSCHAPVHEARFGNECADCHAQIRWLGLPEALGRRVHAQTSYPLLGAHRKTDCAACHRADLPRPERYRGLEFDACKDCHRDVHRGQFADRAGGACEGCHDVAGFAPASFAFDEHASTRLPLEGGHEAAPCAACHGSARPRLDWQLDKLACASCHENPHGARFAEQIAAGGCGSCHGAVDWSIPKLAHDTWPLTGAHQRVRCEQCHTPSEADKRAGGGASYRDAPRECEGCHEDIHMGQFRLSEPVKACTSCHDTKSFELPEFDHQRQTGYLLTGKHAALDCAKCHVPAALKAGERTLLWRLPYDGCKDCHANPHSEDRR